MADIKELPLKQLLDDLTEYARDSERCDAALRRPFMSGLKYFHAKQKETNDKIIVKIRAEITRRIGEKNG